MKKILIFLISFIALFINSNLNAANNLKNLFGELVINSELGFNFTIPRGWQRVEEDINIPGFSKVYLLVPEKANEFPGIMSVLVTSTSSLTSVEDISDLVNNPGQFDELKDSLAPLFGVTGSDLSISKIIPNVASSSLMIEGVAQVEGSQRVVKMNFLFGKNNDLIILLSTPPNKLDVRLESLDAIADEGHVGGLMGSPAQDYEKTVDSFKFYPGYELPIRKPQESVNFTILLIAALILFPAGAYFIGLKSKSTK